MSPIEELLQTKAEFDERGGCIDRHQWDIWTRAALAMILSQLALMSAQGSIQSWREERRLDRMDRKL